MEVFGKKRRPGTLVVDRHAGCNKTPCRRQYCYAHLLREVQDLGKEFSQQQEVQRFVQMLARAMKLRAEGLKLIEFRRQAGQTKDHIVQIVQTAAQHPGIQKIQNLFREQASRLYHWTRHPNIPAEKNPAERELRPLVIARKTSVGSQSERDLQTLEGLMSVLLTLAQRSHDPFATLTLALDNLAANPTRHPYDLLFNSS